MIPLCSMFIFNSSTVDIALVGLPVLLLCYFRARQAAPAESAATVRYSSRGWKAKVSALADGPWDFVLGALAVVAFGATTFTHFPADPRTLPRSFMIAALTVAGSFAVRRQRTKARSQFFADSRPVRKKRALPSFLAMGSFLLGLLCIAQESYATLVAMHTGFGIDCSTRVPSPEGLELLKRHIHLALMWL